MSARSAIAAVDAVCLRAPANDPSDLDSSRETVVVRITDEEGRIGIGEIDAPAAAAISLIEMEDLFTSSRGLANVLRGRDPFELRALHAEMIEETLYHGRRGLGIHVISGVDIALHDLAARQLNRPVFDLLGGARRDAITPYATIWPGGVKGRTVAQMMKVIGDRVECALDLGFRAIKVELIFGELVSDRELVRCILESRQLVGEETMLAIDFGYRWTHWRDVLHVLDAADDARLYFAEATLAHDDIAGYERLAARSRTSIGAAEYAATVHECREWLAAGIDVLQADLSRCGGLGELVRIAELASHYGATVIPHHWKTGITAAASRHFQAATPNCPWIEMFHPALWESPLRSQLTRPEPEIVEGRIALPTGPGLGVELVPEALATYAA